MPVFEVDLPVNIARKAKTVRRVLGELPLSVRLVALDFEHDDLLTALAEHGYRTEYRVFFVCEGVTQYLTERAVRRTLEGLRAAAPLAMIDTCDLESFVTPSVSTRRSIRRVDTPSR